MEIVKPSLLHCSCLPFTRRGQMFQSVTASLGFNLLTGQVLPPADTWSAVMQCLPEDWCLDSGLPKPKAEWLLAGFARTPDQETRLQLTVEVRVGQDGRRFLVRGPAFSAVPLCWEHTVGGPDSRENPLGCGLAGPQFPQIFDADTMDSLPACPGPRGAWPSRMQRLGSFDARWLQTRWPGPPDDNDGSYLNLAQPQQHLPAGLSPGAALELRGLHAEYPVIFSSLPGIQVRVSCLRHDGVRQSLPAILDTLWLFPDRLTGLLLWHSLAPCVDEAASDMQAVILELDPSKNVTIPSALEERPQAEADCPPVERRQEGLTVVERKLAGKNLTGQCLVGQDLSGQDLSKAILDGADFSGADLRRACLRGVRARDADFSHCLLEDANFEEADCSGALLRQVQARGLQAQNANFAKASLRQSDFCSANFSGTILQQADISACCLDGANFQEADFSKAALGEGVSALNCNFAQAVLTQSQWHEVKGKQSVFTQAQASGASFTSCDFFGCDWTKTRAEGVNFLRCDLRQANLRGAHLLRASFYAARLEGAYCVGCNMYGADFCWCKLDATTNMQGALLGCTLLAARAEG